MAKSTQSGEKIEALIRRCLSSFYRRRIAALDSLNLNRVLARKNPYLFMANGISSASEMISEILAAHLSSSDEAIFGEEFFEPICQVLSGAQTAAAKGVDFVIETPTAFEAIALKSGPNAFNSSQVSKQNQQFEEIQKSLRATLRSLRKEFLPVMGCGYGNIDSPPTTSRKYHKLAGQAFWEHITGDGQFYLTLVRLMRDDPGRHRPVFKEAWDRAVERFEKQFAVDFCNPRGEILWEKLAEFNSGKKRSTRRKARAPRDKD